MAAKVSMDELLKHFDKLLSNPNINVICPEKMRSLKNQVEGASPLLRSYDEAMQGSLANQNITYADNLEDSVIPGINEFITQAERLVTDGNKEKIKTNLDHKLDEISEKLSEMRAALDTKLDHRKDEAVETAAEKKEAAEAEEEKKQDAADIDTPPPRRPGF